MRTIISIIAVCLLAMATASAAMQIYTSGSSSGPIVSGDNSGSGYGVEGSGKHNTGVFGKTTGTATNGVAAVVGSDQATGAAALKNVGVLGLSKSGDGVDAFTQSSYGTSAYSASGVAGIDQSTQHPAYHQGVLGLSLNGAGVVGVTKSADVNDAQAATTGMVLTSSSDKANVAVYGYANNGSGVWGIASNGQAGYFHTYSSDVALEVKNSGGGAIMTANNGTSDVMSLDNSGNMIVSGTVTQKGTPQIVVRGRNADAVAYTNQQATPSMEDFGEARLVNGVARVTVDRAFASTVDSSRPYLVFLTPQGMVAGTLCVVERDPAGFTVRESSGGRSTVAFDYRIVASPYRSAAARLPAYRPPANLPMPREFRPNEGRR